MPLDKERGGVFLNRLGVVPLFGDKLISPLACTKIEWGGKDTLIFTVGNDTYVLQLPENCHTDRNMYGIPR